MGHAGEGPSPLRPTSSTAHPGGVIPTLFRRAVGRDLPGALADDVRTYGLGPPRPDRPPVLGNDLNALPDVVQRYLREMGVVGHPLTETLQLRATGRFRLGTGRRAMPCEILQYDTAHPLTRLFHMRLDLFGVVPMVGTDRYVLGRGRMNGRLLGLVTVADGSGPEFDLGELTTFLDDAVLFAPSMLLGLDTTWSEVSDRRFAVTLTDSGHTVRAEVTVDEAGRPIELSSTDRWADLGRRIVRARWSTPVWGWVRRTDGRLVPTRGSAVWHLPEGDHTYAELRFDPNEIHFDV